jgi:hypothetical protein
MHPNAQMSDLAMMQESQVSPYRGITILVAMERTVRLRAHSEAPREKHIQQSRQKTVSSRPL